MITHLFHVLAFQHCILNRFMSTFLGETLKLRACCMLGLRYTLTLRHRIAIKLTL